MALVSIPNISPGQEITSTDINTFITSVNNTSSNLNDDNVQIQGIDTRNLADESVVFKETSEDWVYKEDNNHTINTSSANFDILSTGSPAKNIGVGSQGTLVTVPDGQFLVVYCSFSYYVDYVVSERKNRNSGDGGYELKFKLAYKTTASGGYVAGATDINGTLRRSTIILAGYDNANPGKHILPRASMTIVGVIQNQTGSDETYDVRLLANATRALDTSEAVTAYVKDVQMFGKIVRR